VAPLCFVTLACNSLWSVDELSFGPSPTGGQSPGGSGGQGGQGAGDAGAGGDGGGGGGELDCTGAFGAPEVALSVTGATLGSPAITMDQLELYFTYSSNVGALIEVRRSLRSGQGDFQPGQQVTELTTLCDAPSDIRGLDVTPDGRRAYVGCATTTSDVVVVLAERVDGADAFVEIGPVATMGSSPAITMDELTLYSSGPGSGTGPKAATRDTLQQTFGLGVAVPGVGGFPLRTPGPTPDHLTLFGHLETTSWELGYFARSHVGATYGAFTPVVSDLPIAGSPDVSADCRAVYFVGSVPPSTEPTEIYVMRR